jgi:hypothetical protein
MVEVVFHEIARKNYQLEFLELRREGYFSGRLVILACWTCGISDGRRSRISIVVVIWSGLRFAAEGCPSACFNEVHGWDWRASTDWG